MAGLIAFHLCVRQVSELFHWQRGSGQPSVSAEGGRQFPDEMPGGVAAESDRRSGIKNEPQCVVGGRVDSILSADNRLRVDMPRVVRTTVGGKDVRQPLGKFDGVPIPPGSDDGTSSSS
ncbi:hypothetical protein [Fodinicola feengrottensis]|uniref:hypothetical protein n=1 Tax=Fodinicola feengrottensis TaxID=435914 RepID=UPI002441D1CD|nr:hypothetical protein [Fodinicola feengrottensis]